MKINELYSDILAEDTKYDDYSITKENQNISVISAYSWLVNFQN